jgi:hypothetical protein
MLGTENTAYRLPRKQQPQTHTHNCPKGFQGSYNNDFTHLGNTAASLSVKRALWRHSVGIQRLPWHRIWRAATPCWLVRRAHTVAGLLRLNGQAYRSEIVAAVSGSYRDRVVLQVLRDRLQRRPEKAPAHERYEERRLYV